uniref:Uncharacterized protein n=1 Tax=Anguilla anguilla TaxID=7936 RepID=A0A0E9R6P4_ANGAN
MLLNKPYGKLMRNYIDQLLSLLGVILVSAAAVSWLHLVAVMLYCNKYSLI